MKRGKLKSILLDHIIQKENYYRQKLINNYPLNILIKASIAHQDLSLLSSLILREFPNLKSKILKYLIIQ